MSKFYIAYADEANQETKNAFTVCGLTAIESSDLVQIHTGITRLRSEASFEPSMRLKSDTNTRPAHIDFAQHRDLKNSVLEIASENNCVFFAYCKFNEKSRPVKADQNVQFGMNTLLKNFNRFLIEEEAFGIVQFDRFNWKNPYEYLREKHQQGNHYPSKQEWETLSNILSYGFTADGCSNFASVNDILTGSIRYLANNQPEKTTLDAIVHHLKEVMWCRDGVYRELGLTLRPLDRKSLSASIQAEYDILRHRLNSAG